MQEKSAADIQDVLLSYTGIQAKTKLRLLVFQIVFKIYLKGWPINYNGIIHIIYKQIIKLSIE